MHLTDDFIHELAVVGDEEEGAGIIFQVILEPEKREEIEMVRRLVEQEEVGFHDEQARQPGAHDPAAAHFPGLAAEIGVAIAEAAEHFLGPGFHLGIVEFVVLGVGLHVFGGGDGAGGFEFVQFFLEEWEFLHAAGGNIEDGFVAVGFAFLREVADHGPFITFDGAGVGFTLLENEGKKGGFARAIGADERDAFAVVHLERSVLERAFVRQKSF